MYRNIIEEVGKTIEKEIEITDSRNQEKQKITVNFHYSICKNR